VDTRHPVALSAWRNVPRRTVRAALTLAAVGMLALSACSSSNSSGSSAQTGASGTGANAVSAAAGSTSASSGSTITLMLIADIASPAMALPEDVTGAQAAVNRINAAGGVNGHQLRLLSCNSQANPNTAANCARQAVSDKVSAVVGLESLESGAAVSILQQAGIASIGSTDLTAPDNTSPVSFPIQAADIQDVGEVALTPGWQSCKKPAIMTDSDVPSLAQGVQMMEKLYQTLPTPVTPKVVTITTSTVDPQPQVAAMLSGNPDCVFLDETQTGTLPSLQAIHQSGQSPKISIDLAVASADKMKQLGAAANGVYGQTYFQLPGTTAAASAFSQAFEAVDATGDQDTNAQEAYSAVYIFAAACAKLTDFSSANVLAAMNSAKNIQTPLMATIPSFPADSGVPGYSRVDVYQFYAYQWNNGKYNLLQPNPVDIRTWVDKVTTK
jgi:ABC-type branched-subunit amino acid transport system substrate-binding protein